MAHYKRRKALTAGFFARLLWLLLTIHLLHPLGSSAQNFSFEFSSTAEGLAGNNTATVTQDDRGFLWMVNNGMLHRYDGYNFVAYPAPGRATLLGIATYEDSLLFAWNERHAFLFNPAAGDWLTIQEKENGWQFWQRIGQDRILVTRFHDESPDLRLWQLRDQQLSPLQLPAYVHIQRANNIWCEVNGDGEIFLAWRDTLYHLDQEGALIAATPMAAIGKNCYNLCFRIRPDGTLILLANWRFFVLDKKKNRFTAHPANRFLKPGQHHLHRLILEENGSIWACGDDQNLVYYDATGDTLFNFQEDLKRRFPSTNDFKGLFRDRTGIVWVDTRLGLLKVKPQVYPFDNFFKGLNNSNSFFSFRGFAEDAEGMIYGVFYNGIARFDPAGKRPSRLYHFRDKTSLYDLFFEGDTLWVNGGQFLDPASGGLTTVPSPFFDNPVGDSGFFAKDGTGTLWWLSHFTLFYLQKTEKGARWRKALEFPEKVFNKTEALHAGRHNRKLWISFSGKLLEYDPVSKKQTWHKPADWGLAVSRITAIAEDRNGDLWLGTDEGLARVSVAQGNATLYSVGDGLPDKFVCGLLAESDQNLWLSTNHGLSRFHIPSGTFINFLEEDGLTFNEFNRKSYFKARNGRLIFGGMRGVNAFFPEAIAQAYQSRNRNVRLSLSAFEYTDERTDTIIRTTRFSREPRIYLRHWDWSYTFEFALMDYTNPDEVFYSYQVEGYKDSWSAPSKFNFARFNSLPAGEYVFRVRARDSRGNWHPNELAIPMVVYPPWWASWWAYVLYGMLLFLLFYILRRYELNRQRLKNNLHLEKLEAERLKELDSFKNRLYTNLTHEFRTPLTVILGMAGQMKGEAARLIEANGNNLLRLINQLLDLSRLENHAFQLHLQQADIVPYLRYVTESFQTYANSRNLSLRFFSPAESLTMDFDPEQLKQVLVNLISNALKFTHSGGEVVVRLIPQESRLGIAVQDTGIGIAEAALPHIFDRFYQADNSATRSGEGSGIGLAHARELVTLMEGSLTVQSRPGDGSVFTVLLPLRRTAPKQEATLPGKEGGAWGVFMPEIEPQQEAPATAPDSRPLLLLIEDNPDVVTYLKSILSGQFRLDIAYNGLIGIEKALAELPDLIVSDVMMPEKDGFEVCDTLKNDQRTSHIPLILLTAKADAASRIAGLLRGADAYLAKPFDKEELLVRLNALLERQQRMAAYFSQKLQGGEEPLAEASIQEAIEVESAFIKRVRQIVEENFADDNFALPQLCHEIGMSRSQLFRKMKALIDESPSNFIRNYRLTVAKKLLETTDLNVSEVAWKVGYKYLAHFSTSYQEFFGEPPSRTPR